MKINKINIDASYPQNILTSDLSRIMSSKKRDWSALSNASSWLWGRGSGNINNVLRKWKMITGFFGYVIFLTFSICLQCLQPCWKVILILPDNLPAVALYICSSGKQHHEFIFHNSEQWRATHVRYSLDMV